MNNLAVYVTKYTEKLGNKCLRAVDNKIHSYLIDFLILLFIILHVSSASACKGWHVLP